MGNKIGKDFLQKLWKNSLLPMEGAASQAYFKVQVLVTFLRMNQKPVHLETTLPEGYRVERLETPNIDYYKYLYKSVGKGYCWWMRLACDDHTLKAILHNPAVELYVLFHHTRPAGFFELERCHGNDVNLSYFGLFPHYIGKGIGFACLSQAILHAWKHDPRYLLVNTCTADHPRALPLYKKAGFVPYRALLEEWSIPSHLDIKIPAQLLDEAQMDNKE
ncbi:GNAT family N-acetyltransferase [Entomobacter blattae]|uniref:GNAT family N-acetyltransferase n=1 Tax=Entomobacter blattae TaxID=2762277 RepID=UPI00193B4BD3|nr:GNAT family N-acetyltransferase [Entomobacter blattae]